MKFLTLTLAAVLTLAFSFTATPAAALDPLARCRVYNAKIKMNYAKCLELDNLLVEKGKAAKGICDSKRTASLEKAVAKFVTKLGVDPADCGIETATTEADQALQLLASGATLSDSQTNSLAHNGTIESIADEAAEDACETADGTWESDTCTASEPPYDCAVGALCSAWYEYPEWVDKYPNRYSGDIASDNDCDAEEWANVYGYAANTSFRSHSYVICAPIECFGDPCCGLFSNCGCVECHGIPGCTCP